MFFIYKKHRKRLLWGGCMFHTQTGAIGKKFAIAAQLSCYNSQGKKLWSVSYSTLFRMLACPLTSTALVNSVSLKEARHIYGYSQQKMSLIVRDLWISRHEVHQQAFNNHRTVWILVYCLVWKTGNILGRVIYFPLVLKANEKHEEGNLSFVTSACQIWVPRLLQTPEHVLSLQVIKVFFMKRQLLQRRLLHSVIPVPGLTFKPPHP